MRVHSTDRFAGRFGRLVALLAALALALAACGGDDAGGEDTPADTETTEAESPAENETADGDTGDGEAATLDGPVQVAHVVSQSGPNALPFFQDGFQYAVDEINAAGGILGQPIEATVYDTELSAEVGANAVRKAISDGNEFIICCSGGAVYQAAAPIITEAGIPTLGYSLGAPGNLSEAAGSEWIWRMAHESYVAIVAAAKFYAEELGVEGVGLTGLNIDYGTLAVPVMKNVFEEAGVEVVAEQLYPFDVTDVTDVVLELEDAPAVIDWSYPNQNGLVLSRLTQEGYDGPFLGSASVSVMVDRELAPAEALPNTYSTTMCWAADDERTEVREWAAAFQEEFGYEPDFGATGAYDAVYVMKAAIEAAGSTDPAALADALNNEVEIEGKCARTYRSDSEHRLNRDVVVVRFNEDGSGEIVQRYENLDVAPYVDERVTS